MARSGCKSQNHSSLGLQAERKNHKIHAPMPKAIRRVPAHFNPSPASIGLQQSNEFCAGYQSKDYWSKG